MTKNSPKGIRLSRLLALFLTLTLSIPYPVFALRTEGVDAPAQDSQPGKQTVRAGLEAALREDSDQGTNRRDFLRRTAAVGTALLPNLFQQPTPAQTVAPSLQAAQPPARATVKEQELTLTLPPQLAGMYAVSSIRNFEFDLRPDGSMIVSPGRFETVDKKLHRIDPSGFGARVQSGAVIPWDGKVTFQIMEPDGRNKGVRWSGPAAEMAYIYVYPSQNAEREKWVMVIRVELADKPGGDRVGERGRILYLGDPNKLDLPPRPQPPNAGLEGNQPIANRTSPIVEKQSATSDTPSPAAIGQPPVNAGLEGKGIPNWVKGTALVVGGAVAGAGVVATYNKLTAPPTQPAPPVAAAPSLQGEPVRELASIRQRIGADGQIALVLERKEDLKELLEVESEDLFKVADQAGIDTFWVYDRLFLDLTEDQQQTFLRRMSEAGLRSIGFTGSYVSTSPFGRKEDESRIARTYQQLMRERLPSLDLRGLRVQFGVTAEPMTADRSDRGDVVSIPKRFVEADLVPLVREFKQQHDVVGEPLVTVFDNPIKNTTIHHRGSGIYTVIQPELVPNNMALYDSRLHDVMLEIRRMETQGGSPKATPARVGTMLDVNSLQGPNYIQQSVVSLHDGVFDPAYPVGLGDLFLIPDRQFGGVGAHLRYLAEPREVSFQVTEAEPRLKEIDINTAVLYLRGKDESGYRHTLYFYPATGKVNFRPPAGWDEAAERVIAIYPPFTGSESDAKRGKQTEYPISESKKAVGLLYLDAKGNVINAVRLDANFPESRRAEPAAPRAEQATPAPAEAPATVRLPFHADVSEDALSITLPTIIAGIDLGGKWLAAEIKQGEDDSYELQSEEGIPKSKPAPKEASVGFKAKEGRNWQQAVGRRISVYPDREFARQNGYYHPILVIDIDGKPNYRGQVPAIAAAPNAGLEGNQQIAHRESPRPLRSATSDTPSPAAGLEGVERFDAATFEEQFPNQAQMLPADANRIVVVSGPVTFYRPESLASGLEQLIQAQAAELAGLEIDQQSIPANRDQVRPVAVIVRDPMLGDLPYPSPVPVVDYQLAQPFPYTAVQLVNIAIVGGLDAATVVVLTKWQFEYRGRQLTAYALQA